MFAKVFTTAALLTAVSASPLNLWSPPSLPDGTLFKIQVGATNDAPQPIQGSFVTAANRGLFANYAASDAVCTGDNGGAAVFFIQGGCLYLYTAEGGQPERMWTDRSDAGQGVLEYSLGDEYLPKSAEITGFALDAAGGLTFDGSAFVGCPTGDPATAAWSLWIGAGTDTPNGLKGCVAFVAQAIEDKDAFPCEYSAPPQ